MIKLREKVYISSNISKVDQSPPLQQNRISNPSTFAKPARLPAYMDVRWPPMLYPSDPDEWVPATGDTGSSSSSKRSAYCPPLPPSRDAGHRPLPPAPRFASPHAGAQRRSPPATWAPHATPAPRFYMGKRSSPCRPCRTAPTQATACKFVRNMAPLVHCL